MKQSFLTTSLVLMLLLGTQGFATTADHTKFEILQQEFKSGPEVTKACLSCHTEASMQIHATKHWTWDVTSHQDQNLGKRHVINNFCIGTQGNEPRCTSCHTGFGWKDDTFDFTSEERVDCLVCHDKTGTYKKFPTKAGDPVLKDTKFKTKMFKGVDLAYVAQNVGETSRETCGACHFYGGGGDGVKHGDLDGSLLKPTRQLDVHMGVDGENFSCSQCHSTDEHSISGSRYDPLAIDHHGIDLPAPDLTSSTCESCHGLSPHVNIPKYNDHVDKVACQTCHIPFMAVERPTKMWWDWSKAGKFDENGKHLKLKDERGFVTYMTAKGEFVWEQNIKPEYKWFNGNNKFVLPGDPIDDSKVVVINPYEGSYDDTEARIWPVKVHRGKQIYDSKNKTFVVPKLFGKKGSGAYWKDFDWDKAIRTNAEEFNFEYSGEFGFVETEMNWALNHMVQPKEQAVTCNECHSRDGRLAGLAGFYLPGRDSWSWLDILGKLMILGSIFGVLVHGSIRFVAGRRRDS